MADQKNTLRGQSRWRRCVAGFAPVTFTAAACGSDGESEPTPEDLIGSWATVDGIMWEITADRLVATGEADVQSSYSSTETTIEITDIRSNCGPDPVGAYERAIDDDVLTITLVSDYCRARANALDGAEFARQEPEPPGT